MRCCDCWRWPVPHWEVTVIQERSARGDGEHHGGARMEREPPVLWGSVVTLCRPHLFLGLPLLIFKDGSNPWNIYLLPSLKVSKRLTVILSLSCTRTLAGRLGKPLRGVLKQSFLISSSRNAIQRFPNTSYSSVVRARRAVLLFCF